jgi:hypothetical protein
MPPSWPALVVGGGLSVWWPVSVGNREVLVRVVDAGLGVEPRIVIGDVEVAPSLAVRGGVAIGARLDAQGQTRWTPSALVEGGVRVGTGPIFAGATIAVPLVRTRWSEDGSTATHTSALVQGALWVGVLWGNEGSANTLSPSGNEPER